LVVIVLAIVTAAQSQLSPVPVFHQVISNHLYYFKADTQLVKVKVVMF